MSIISCPECGKEISSHAKACIHCGYPLKNIDITQPLKDNKNYYYILKKNEIVIAIDMNSPSSSEEIKQLIENGFSVTLEKVYATSTKDAIDIAQYGLSWWHFFGISSLIVSFIVLIIGISNESPPVIMYTIVNIILSIFTIKHKKIAFIVLTLLTLNPILWIINGIYIRHRWYHPEIS